MTTADASSHEIVKDHDSQVFDVVLGVEQRGAQITYRELDIHRASVGTDSFCLQGYSSAFFDCVKNPVGEEGMGDHFTIRKRVDGKPDLELMLLKDDDGYCTVGQKHCNPSTDVPLTAAHVDMLLTEVVVANLYEPRNEEVKVDGVIKKTREDLV